MSKVKLTGESSGYVEISAGTAAGNNTLELPTSGVKIVGSDHANNVDNLGVVTATTFSGNLTGDVTVATGATISGSTNTITALTNGSERVRIDSSGRMLLGVNSTSQTTTFIAQGSSSGAANAAVIRLARGTDSPVDSNTLGVVYFTDSNHGDSSAVYAARDGGTWTSGASEPTRLVFATTADGASTMSERARITSTGNVQIANGNLVFSTSGTGIDFSATDDGGTTTPNELLDDYEEGTWTPSFTGLTGASYDTQDGVYTKVGNLIYCECRVKLSNTGTASGAALQITGFPYNSSSSLVSRLGAYSINYITITGQDEGTLEASYLGSSTAVFSILENGHVSVLNTALTNTSQVDLMIVYRTL